MFETIKEQEKAREPMYAQLMGLTGQMSATVESVAALSGNIEATLQLRMKRYELYL
jgi:hypothetical protein